MIREDVIRLVVFLFVAGVIFVLACLIAGLWLVRTLRRKPAPVRTPTGRWSRRGVLSLAGAGVGGLAWGRFVEPYWLETTHVKLAFPKLAGLTRPIRIAHFSDTHCDPAVRAEDALVAGIKHFRPDLVAFTGDCINSPEGLPIFQQTLRRIAGIAPTYVVRGNWDGGMYGIRTQFDGTGARELAGTWETVDLAGARLHLGGLDCASMWMLARALEARPREGFRLFLYHFPDGVYEAAKAGVDLYLAGHTHGGQVALPWYGAIVTLSRYGKRFEHGLYRVGETTMYVNRGIGMEGGPAPRMRLFARPELTCYEIHPAT